ncbi:MAG: ethanolamine utilization protein EutH [Peptoclostridium sp.]|uniref:ethanolamine utilization protein EutH n=1 Tax=Peptoclostridium sp. TaxID=1904860 RepID=UPI00139F1533|nr:ethanolamine utilization protein EutH [Peptoclostridium sp.]MZQ75787.1 ethanolamine utilization protein EutH [Peptoclostridium sp.]
MNIFIAIMLLLAGMGLLDKMLGGKLGLCEEFDRGLVLMGPMAFSVVGIYCIGITAVQANAQSIAALAESLPFDASVLIGSMLATDLGGYAISKNVASTPLLGLFSGAIVASTLGCAVSFQLPVSLATIPKEEVSHMMNGLLLGIITIPAGLLAGGIMLGLSVRELAINIAPVALLCFLLALAFVKATKATIRVMSIVGYTIRAASFAMFGLVIAGLFMPAWRIVDMTLVNEILIILAKMTAVVCGSMVLSRLAILYCRRPLDWISGKLDINEKSVMGLMLSLTTSLSMLPLFPHMDRRGKVMNAAFTVSGAYVLGGQLAFIASVEGADVVSIYMISKLIGGMCALAAAALFTTLEEGCGK